MNSGLRQTDRRTDREKSALVDKWNASVPHSIPASLFVLIFSSIEDKISFSVSSVCVCTIQQTHIYCISSHQKKDRKNWQMSTWSDPQPPIFRKSWQIIFLVFSEARPYLGEFWESPQKTMTLWNHWNKGWVIASVCLYLLGQDARE